MRPLYHGDTGLNPSGFTRTADRVARQFLDPLADALPERGHSASPSWPATPLNTKRPMDCALVGKALLYSSFFNKGSAFSLEERQEFLIDGLLPPAVSSLEEQVGRAYGQFKELETPILQNAFLQSLRDQNEVLFYKLVSEHLTEMMSVIYTPTEGEAIEKYSHMFRRPEGCFLTVNEKEKVRDVLARWGNEDEIDYIVVSDGEEILGIGDQGVGGIGISSAKLVLMTLCAGIHPNRTLPVVLDCGTDNESLRNDELYLGLRQPRVRGKEYDEFLDIFVQSVKELFPKAYLHFEDFGLSNARRLLDIYRPQLACFNDDIQGTGAVTLAAIMSAVMVCKMKLSDIRMVIFGAGSAGTGIADQVRDAIAELEGVNKSEASERIWLVDKQGLLLSSMGDKLTDGQKSYAKDEEECGDLVEIIARVKPHVLIGTSTKPKAFTEGVVREMCRHVERPIIFPLSNPTRLHEADPKDINEWSGGKALITTGSPFPPVEYEGRKYIVAECNNSCCFPGIGLGCVLSRASHLTDGMLVAAVKALADMSPALEDPDKGLLPDVEDVRLISTNLAMAVIKKAVEDKVARVNDIPVDNDDRLRRWVVDQMWKPEYRPLRKVEFAKASRAAKDQVGPKGRGG